ncbi:MAG: flagellar P-ring protein precursor FlgI [Planctomycetota bacterium]|jgi:flagellar P-ring protein precursor FlgI
MNHITKMTLALLLLASQAMGQARIAEITDIEGVRDNQVTGIGLVVGLNGSGDKSLLARRMAVNLYQKFGINTTPQEVGTGNLAVVQVTGRLDPFKRPGAKIDVTVSSMQDASDLYGGTLMETLLVGKDQKTVYAIAEGPLSSAGLQAVGDSGSSVTINHPTVAGITNGARVEKSVPMQIEDSRHVIRFHLKNQNWKTASNIQNTINELFPKSAKAINAGGVEVKVPEEWRLKLTEFIAAIQELRTTVDMISKVIINRKTGVIVAGENVRISKVAVAVGSINITIEEAPLPVIANPFTNGPGIGEVPRTEARITEEASELSVLPGGSSVADLAASLNKLKLTPNQLISILEEIKAAGALHADMEIR